MSTAPPVTVIALCFNHERFVIECLESIKAQTFRDFELIVTDDCSRDNSANLIEKWLSENWQDANFIRHEANVGICRTLNEALSVSSGKFISMIATDDVWEPHKIEHQLTFMLTLPENVAVVYSDSARIDELGNRLNLSFIEAHKPGYEPPSGNIFSSLADGNFIPAMSTLIRKSAIESVGNYDEELTYEDYDMWLRLSHKFNFFFQPGIVAKYRIVNTSMVRTLFDNPSPNHSYSVFQICEKWLPSGLLTPLQRKDWVKKQSSAAYSLYCHNDKRAVPCLWISVFRTWKPKLFLLAVTFSLGITRGLAKKLTFRQN